MTTELKTVAIAPLNETNYPTWKVQCQMALVHDGLWVIVNGTETAPDKVRLTVIQTSYIKLNF